MSGLCGWYDGYADAHATRQLLDRMAAPLTRFDLCSVQSAAGSHSGAAIAARSDSADFYQQDGLLVAIWGRPGIKAAALALLWRAGGAKACGELSGPFAVCILDERNDEALLAVDRSGTHALCYQVTPDGLIFASSVDALVSHPAARRDLDPQAIYNYLYFHMVPAPNTIYQGQQRLLPGEYLHYSKGSAQRGTYWKMQFQERERLPFGTLKNEFLATLRSSVTETIGGHQVGAFLSGGTDSSTLAGVLGQVSGRAARTYSIGFAVDGYDEMDYARFAPVRLWCTASPTWLSSISMPMCCWLRVLHPLWRMPMRKWQIWWVLRNLWSSILGPWTLSGLKACAWDWLPLRNGVFQLYWTQLEQVRHVIEMNVLNFFCRHTYQRLFAAMDPKS